MRGWGIEPVDAEKILSQLIDQQFIDDERFAKAYTREKIHCSGWGVHKIRAALSAKGIARETIDSTLQTLDKKELNDRLEKYLTRKQQKIKAETSYEMRSKLTRYGLSLGYDYEAVSHALSRLLLIVALAIVPAVTSAQSTDYYRNPLDIPIYFSANFGEIRTNRFHTGIDLKTQGSVGKPLFAAADGHISRISVAPSGYGRALYITHPNGTTTVYAHMDRFTPELEAYLKQERYRQKHSDLDIFPPAARFPVKKGQSIGSAGNSGASSGPHLHYEVRQSSSSRTLNVIARSWVTPATKDTTPPRIVRLYHIDVDTLAGIPVHSRPRPYDVKLDPDGNYSLVRTSPLPAGPTSYFVIEATDRKNDVTNTFGIYRAALSVDGTERLVLEKDGLLFDEVRYACASALYSIQRSSRNEAIMLALKSNNLLGMYKKVVNRGVLAFPQNTSQTPIRQNVLIAIEDDSDNEVTLSFAVTYNQAHTPAARPEGRMASDRADFTNYAEGLSVSIPKGALYEPIAYIQSVVQQTIQVRADSIRPLSPLHKIGDGILPLQKAMKIAVAADVPASLRSRACLAKVSDKGGLAWAGGRYENGIVNGSVRDFGVYCVVADAKPPVIKSSFNHGADLSKTASVTFTASDNFSGIADFTGSIDGEWVIFERTASRGLFTHKFDLERLETGKDHTFEFRVRDGVGNVTTWRGTFYK